MWRVIIIHTWYIAFITVVCSMQLAYFCWTQSFYHCLQLIDKQTMNSLRIYNNRYPVLLLVFNSSKNPWEEERIWSLTECASVLCSLLETYSNWIKNKYPVPANIIYKKYSMTYPTWIMVPVITAVYTHGVFNNVIMD